MKSTDVIISGGGIPGLTLGIILAQAGLDVVLCDPSPLIPVDQVKPSGRTAALMEGSLAVLNQAGLLENVEALSEDLKILAVIDGDFKAEFKSSEIGMERFGQNIQNSLLQAYAAEKFRSLSNAKLLQDKITNFEISGKSVTTKLSNGEIFTAKILIGADGRNSPVRTSLGIDIWKHDYDQMALTGIVAHTKSHRNASTESHFSGGPFTMVPMKNNKCSFVWMEKTEDAQKIINLPKAEIESIMQARSGNIVGELSLVTDVTGFPIIIQNAKSLISDRVALIAEAAHVLSPIGAQGMNLSLRDVSCLSEVILKAARLGIDYGLKSVLKTYQDERFSDISLRVVGTDALNRSVATDNAFAKTLKRLGFKAAANIAPLRSILIHEALAPRTSLAQDILSALETRATVRTSTIDAPAA